MATSSPHPDRSTDQHGRRGHQAEHQHDQNNIRRFPDTECHIKDGECRRQRAEGRERERLVKPSRPTLGVAPGSGVGREMVGDDSDGETEHDDHGDPDEPRGILGSVAVVE
jgi:hypothetical protein